MFLDILQILISFLFEILLKEQYFSFLRIIQAYDYLKC